MKLGETCFRQIARLTHRAEFLDVNDLRQYRQYPKFAGLWLGQRRFVDEHSFLRIRFGNLLRDVGDYLLSRLDLREIQLATLLLLQPAVLAVVQQPPPLQVRRCDDDVTVRVAKRGAFERHKRSFSISPLVVSAENKLDGKEGQGPDHCALRKTSDRACFRLAHFSDRSRFRPASSV